MNDMRKLIEMVEGNYAIKPGSRELHQLEQAFDVFIGAVRKADREKALRILHAMDNVWQIIEEPTKDN